MRCAFCSAVSTEQDGLLDLPWEHGRPDRAVPELQHADALGDIGRALRRMRLHPALLRGRSLQLTRSVSHRRRRDRGGERDASCRSCEAPSRAPGLRDRCGGSCAAYRADSPCAADEVSEPSWLRSVTNSRHGGRGGFEISAIARRLRRTPDTPRGTEDPAGVSGHLRGLARIMEHAGRLCPGKSQSRLSDPFRPAGLRRPALDVEVVVCCNVLASCGVLTVPLFRHVCRVGAIVAPTRSLTSGVASATRCAPAPAAGASATERHRCLESVHQSRADGYDEGRK